MNNREIVLMKFDSDCEVAAIATATGKTWQEARNALGWEPLNYGLENPIFGNPINLYHALLKLGYWKRNITLSDMFKCDYKPLETIVLLHDERNPILYQHWAILGGYDAVTGTFEIYLGYEKEPIFITSTQFTSMFLKGFPNCAFQVYKANPLRLVVHKTLNLLSRIKKKIGGW